MIHPKLVKNVVERTRSLQSFQGIEKYRFGLLALSGSDCGTSGFANSCCECCGYLAVAGGVLSAVSQMTVDDDAKSEEDL
jgi:hypothetical protein